MVGNKEKTLSVGTYDVGKDISEVLAAKVLKWGKAEQLKPDQKRRKTRAPENKVVQAPESKASVEGPADSDSGAGPESN